MLTLAQQDDLASQGFKKLIDQAWAAGHMPDDLAPEYTRNQKSFPLRWRKRTAARLDE